MPSRGRNFGHLGGFGGSVKLANFIFANPSGGSLSPPKSLGPTPNRRKVMYWCIFVSQTFHADHFSFPCHLSKNLFSLPVDQLPTKISSTNWNTQKTSPAVIHPTYHRRLLHLRAREIRGKEKVLAMEMEVELTNWEIREDWVEVKFN